jgi:hypothetical protein
MKAYWAYFASDEISNLDQNGHGRLCFAMKISLKTLAAMWFFICGNQYWCLSKDIGHSLQLASVQCVTRFWEMYLCLLSDVRIFIAFSIFFLFPLQMCKYLCNSEDYEALWSIIVSLHIELVWNQFLMCGHWPGNKLIRRFQLIDYVMKILGRAWRLESKKWSSYSL